MALPDVIDLMRPCIVQITCVADDQSQVLGTGFILTEDAYVVTAQHVIQGIRDKARDADEASASVGLGWPNTEEVRSVFCAVEFDVLTEDPEHDLALLQMRKNPWKGEVDDIKMIDGSPVQPLYGAAELDTSRPRDGASIAVSGYPLQESTLITNVGIIASAWSNNIEQSPHPTDPTAETEKRSDVYLGDVQCNPGNSGGPVFSLDSGAVIGVLIAVSLQPVMDDAGIDVPGLHADSGLAIIAPAKYVTQMLP